MSAARLLRQRAASTALPALVFALALALYVRTGAPTLLTGDQAEHQYTAYVLGVPHATGYPLFTGLNALAARLLPFGDVARRVTLMAALWSALAVALAYAVAARLSSRRLAGLLAAATLAVSSEFWSLALIAEVYTLQVLLILLLWWCLLAWWERPDSPGWLYGAAFVAGLATTHHGSFVPIVMPALLLAAAPALLSVRHRQARGALAPLGIAWQAPASINMRWGLLARCVAWGIMGLAPWLYLAAQFALFRPFDYYRGQGLPYHYYWGNPASWADVANLALGAGFRDKVFTHGWGQFAALSLRFVATLQQEMWRSGFALGALGGIVLLLRQPRAGRFSALVFTGAALFGINVAGDVPKAHVYYLPAYAIWSVWAGVGAGWLAEQAGELSKNISQRFAQVRRQTSTPARARQSPIVAAGMYALLLGLLALPLLLGQHRFTRLDRSGDDAPRQFAAGVLDAVAPNAVILCRWEQCEPLRYMQLVEQRRLDVQLDQTEPEAGADWAARAALYLPQHPVYAIQFNAQLADRYQIYPLSESYDLWELRDTQASP